MGRGWEVVAGGGGTLCRDTWVTSRTLAFA